MEPATVGKRRTPPGWLLPLASGLLKGRCLPLGRTGALGGSLSGRRCVSVSPSAAAWKDNLTEWFLRSTAKSSFA